MHGSMLNPGMYFCTILYKPIDLTMLQYSTQMSQRITTTIFSTVLAKKVIRERSNSRLAYVRVKHYLQTYSKIPIHLGYFSGTMK